MKKILEFSQDNIVQVQQLQEHFHNRNRTVHGHCVGISSY